MISHDKQSLFHLQQVWLNSIEDETAGLLLEENRNTFNALDSLIKKQDGIDEDDPLMRSLAHILHKKILNITQFKMDQRNKELLAAEQKNKYKGQKCEQKPTSMDIHITLKNTQLSQNYFDQSQRIIAEQQKQLQKQMQKYVI